MDTLLTATSLSGGKTSAYMAIHHPTDVYLFAPVLTNDPETVIGDCSLRSYCQGKVPWFDWDKGGSREVDLTLHNLRLLEQELGKEIIWVSAPFTFDQLIDGSVDKPIARAFGRSSTKSAMLPNAKRRFCTESLKVYPIAWWLHLHSNGNPWIVNIGFRADEPQRVNGWKCDRTLMTLQCDITGKHSGKHRHTMIDYRIARFPLWEAGATSFDVGLYWHNKGWKFPAVSNCDFCFHHRYQEMQTQYEEYPQRATWWVEQEHKAQATFGKQSVEDLIHGSNIDDLPLFSCLCHD